MSSPKHASLRPDGSPHIWAAFLLSILVVPADGLGAPPIALFDAPFLAVNGGPRPHGIAAGDLNGDARPDIAVAGDGDVAVLFGKGDGTFEHRVTVPKRASDVELGDLDGDGDLDLVAGGTAFLNLGAGAFGPATSFAASVGEIALGDMNRDGKLDVVAVSRDVWVFPGVSVFLGNGDGTFHLAATVPVELMENDVALGDLDGDGLLDVAVPHGRSLEEHPCWSVLGGNGDGTLDSPIGYGPCGVTHPGILAIVDPDGDGVAEVLPDVFQTRDLNGDGRLDLVAGFNGTAVTVRLGQPGGTLSPAQSFRAGRAISDIAIADFDLDGALDLAVATWGCEAFGVGGYFCQPEEFPTTISVLRGHGDGTFGGGGTTVNGLTEVGATAIADVDGDGRQDLVALRGSGFAGFASVLIGNGSGGFGPATDYTVAAYPTDLVVADLDADGRPDLAAASYNGAMVTVLHNLGGGVLGDRHEYPPGGRAQDIAVGLVTADAIPDLVVSVFGSSGLSMLRGRGDGTFDPAVSSAAEADRLELGDMDEDGILDVVATHYNGVKLLRGTGAGTFTRETLMPTAHQPSDLALADFNRDGHLDVVFGYNELTPTTAYGTVTLRLGNGNGTFQPARSFDVGSQPIDVKAADVDLDGFLDIVTADDQSESVSLLLGNGDGTFREKLGYGAMGRLPQRLSLGDLNQDAVPDLVISHFYANRITVLIGQQGSPTATVLAFFQAERTSEGIEVRWRFADPGSVVEARLERSETPEGPWRSIEAEIRDEGGASVALDRAATDGHAYAYRLIAIDSRGETRTFGPLAVGGAMAVLAPRVTVAPNPSAGPVRFEYEVPEGPVRLSVVDLQGRRVALLVAGRARSGHQVVTWNGSELRGRVRSGIYIALLETPSGAVTRRFIVAR